MNSKIAQINDEIRARLSPCFAEFLRAFDTSEILIPIRHKGETHKVHITTGAMVLQNLPKVFESIRSFADFSEDNDPHGEHDFGSVDVNGESYFWKFDYYDSDFKFFRENGNRVLTIMLAEEY